MNSTDISIVVVVLSLVLVAVTEVRGISVSRVKPQSDDVQAAEYLEWIALGGKFPQKGCIQDACGGVDQVNRVRRSSSDQRVAELMALMALVQSRAQGQHGQYAPLKIGRRKRAFLPRIGTKEDKMRYDLVKAIVNKEAEGLSRENAK